MTRIFSARDARQGRRGRRVLLVLLASLLLVLLVWSGVEYYGETIKDGAPAADTAPAGD